MEIEIGMFVASAAAVLLPFLLWCLKWITERWHLRGLQDHGTQGSKLPPGSMGWPLVGELLDFLWCFKFLGRPDDFIAKRKARYGDGGVYKTHLFGYPTIITCTPQLNKQVLGSMTEEGIVGPGWPSTQLMGSSSVVIVSGAAHKRVRRHLMEAFNSPKALRAMFATAQPILISAFEQWASKGKINAYNETKAVTFCNICDMLVSFKSRPLLDQMERLYRGFMAGVRSMTINVPGTAYHHALKCRKKLTEILQDEVRIRTEGNIQKQDFLQVLVDSTDEDGSKMTEVEIVQNIVSLILGGYESTSNVMTWALYYLAKYPGVLQKLKEEIGQMSNQKSEDELLTLEDTKEMKYTSKVADELIRLSNVSPFIFRRVVKDDVILNGYKLPKNWKDSKPKIGTYTVFGYGQRYCPGNNFARFQVIMFLYHVCLKYR
ncbi:hypothetical protein ACLOJK_032668 [Asimina triloba]